MWGSEWQAKHIQFHSDNMAVVEILKGNSSKDSTIMHLLRCLHFFCTCHEVHISTVHIPGVNNVGADALSRNNTNLFLLLSPNGIAANTHKMYSVAQRLYQDFCTRMNFTSLPASEAMLILFVTELAQTQAQSTIKTYLSGVQHLRMVWKTH